MELENSLAVARRDGILGKADAISPLFFFSFSPSCFVIYMSDLSRQGNGLIRASGGCGGQYVDDHDDVEL